MCTGRKCIIQDHLHFVFKSKIVLHQQGESDKSPEYNQGQQQDLCMCTHAHAHTHTHVRFCEKWGHPIGVMVFILYKLYVLLPYTYPIPKLSPHRRLCISTFPKKTSLCMIYKRFEKWGHGSMSWKVTFTL